MIPMSCPSCGRRGNVPLDRLNTRMHCKKCDAVFHLDATGKPLLGEPPSAKGGKGGKAARGGRSKDEPLDPIGIVAAKIASLPRGVWYTLAGAAGLYLLYVAIRSYGPRPLSPREALIDQCNAAATAFVDKDEAALAGMATSDSREELKQLIETFRPMVGDSGAKSADMPPTVTTELPDPPEAQSRVVVNLQPPVAEDGTGPPVFFLDLVWVYSKDRFYLDGKATLEANQEREKLRKEAEAEKKKK